MKQQFKVFLLMSAFLFMASIQVKAQQVRVTFHNTSEYTITSMKSHFCNSDTWGSNLLSQSTDHRGVLYPGEKFTVLFSGAGCYDFKIEDEDGYVCEEYDIQVSAADNGKVVEIPDLSDCHND